MHGTRSILSLQILPPATSHLCPLKLTLSHGSGSRSDCVVRHPPGRSSQIPKRTISLPLAETALDWTRQWRTPDCTRIPAFLYQRHRDRSLARTPMTLQSKPTPEPTGLAQQKAEQAEIVKRLSIRINAALDIDEILLDLHKDILGIFDAEDLTLYAVDTEKRRLSPNSLGWTPLKSPGFRSRSRACPASRRSIFVRLTSSTRTTHRNWPAFTRLSRSIPHRTKRRDFERNRFSPIRW